MRGNQAQNAMRAAFAAAGVFILTASGGGLADAAVGRAAAVQAEQVEAAADELARIADSEGALGYYWDSVARQYVLVIASGAASGFSASDVLALGVSVRVEARDIARATVDEVLSNLEALKASVNGAFGFYFDAQSGRVVLQAQAPITAFAAVTDKYPDLIEYHKGTFELTGWKVDTEPFDGGAWLQGGSCTAAFAAQTSTGAKRMVTAGHCFAHDDVTNMGTVVRTSGPWPTYDLELIKGKTYEGAIYDSPNTTRPVKTAANPGIGQNYCTTGSSSGFVCTWIVRSLNVTICYPSDYPGCAHGLAGFLPPTDQGTQYVIPGDSGGPLWFKYADGSAGVRGVISGRFFDVATFRVYSYATMYQYVVSERGVNALLLPAP